MNKNDFVNNLWRYYKSSLPGELDKPLIESINSFIDEKRLNESSLDKFYEIVTKNSQFFPKRKELEIYYKENYHNLKNADSYVPEDIKTEFTRLSSKQIYSIMKGINSKLLKGIKPDTKETMVHVMFERWCFLQIPVMTTG